MAGLTSTGFEVKSFDDVRRSLYARAREVFGNDVDLTEASPLRHFLDAIALIISDKGLERKGIDAIWPVLHDVFYSAYPATATGAALSYALEFRRMGLQSASYAEGVCTFEGPSGTAIASGVTFAATTGAQFQTIEPGVIGDLGWVNLKCRAVTPGEDGNVSAGAIDTVLEGSSIRVKNDNRVHTLVLVSNAADQLWAIPSPSDSPLFLYQVVDVGNIYYPIMVSGIEAHLANSSGSTWTGDVYWEIYDDANPTLMIARTSGIAVTLQPGETIEASWVGEDLDVRGYSKVRLVPRAIRNTQGYGEIQIGGSSRGSGLFMSGLEVGGLTLRISSEVRGEFSGGRPAETEAEARRRYLEVLDVGGSSRLTAIKSKLMALREVLDVHVSHNPTNRDLRAQGGLPPHSVHVVVRGGRNPDIANALLSTLPVGIYTHGNVSVYVEDEAGQGQVVRFSRPTQVPIYVVVSINQKSAPIDIDSLKNNLISYVGGQDTQGVQRSGVRMGGAISYIQVTKIVAEQDGVESAEVYIAKGQWPKASHEFMADISLEGAEVAELTPERIRVV